MDRPTRYKAQAASHRRIPLQEAPSRGNAGRVVQMPKQAQSSTRHTPSNDENYTPSRHPMRSTVANGSTPHPQALDKRVAAIQANNLINNLRPLKTHIGPWQLGTTIGQGGSCTVRHVRHSKTGEHAVAKVVHKTTAQKIRARSLVNLIARFERADNRLGANFELPPSLEREVVITCLLSHPNIVRLLDVWENSDDIYLILEKVDGGELFQYLARAGTLTEEHTMHLFRQLVQALAYCHRYSIFHRDLKPENILLDKQGLTIKLIDFGMAAHQPIGDKLKTPCGSPHYAAPELLEGGSYDGNKADVWSLGVIVYLMLTGELPFNFDKNDTERTRMGNLYGKIKRANINVPETLSPEAKDFLDKVFVANPKKRPNVFQLWDLPLLRKYNPRREPLDHWNDFPRVENWKPLQLGTIDPQIFRNLQLLWHDAEEEILVEQLCNKEMNREKYFYNAIQRYYEEQLNCMDRSPTRTGLTVSDSDYHHYQVRRTRSRADTQTRSNSQFSVYLQEHMVSKHSFFETLPGDDHFDPFGIESSKDQASIISSEHSSLQKPSLRIVKPATRSGPQRNSLRVETLKKRGSLRNSLGFRGGSSNTSAHASSESKGSQSISLGSMHQQPTSIQHIMRLGDRHKRNVSFEHRRRNNTSTTASSGVLPFERSPEKTSSGLPLPSIPPSSPLAAFATPAKHSHLTSTAQTPRTRRLQEFDIEARKVSNELGKVMEEAFFPPSLSERSLVSSLSDLALNNAADTPPSSLSNQSAGKASKAAPTDQRFLNRPLPPPPPRDENPTSYTAREIQEFRNRLALRYAQDGASNQKVFNDILAQLDRLAPAVLVPGNHQQSKRHGGSGQLLSDFNLLQCIPEEGHESSFSGGSVVAPAKSSAQRLVETASPSMARKNTIRVVEPSSPTSPSYHTPLNVRKTSAMTNTSETMTVHRQGATLNEAFSKGNGLKLPKSSWWRRHTEGREALQLRRVEPISPSNEWEDLDDRITTRRDRLHKPTQIQALRYNGKKQTISGRYPGMSSERVMYGLNQPQSPEIGADATIISNTDEWGHLVDTTLDSSRSEENRGFLRSLFQKKRLQRPIYNVDKNSSMNTLDKLSEEYESGVATMARVPSSNTHPGEWNFLYRLLRIKPECRVLVMCHSRRSCRSILSQLILAEESNGMKDFKRDVENRNSFTIRLDKDNSWNLKPVWFAMELFSILRDGHASKLTAIRFTQTRGSANSLRKLVDMLGEYLHDTHLHKDSKETKEIVNLIKTGRPDIRDC